MKLLEHSDTDVSYIPCDFTEADLTLRITIMTTFHVFQCREGEFSYQAESKQDAMDKALASYLCRRIRQYPHVDTAIGVPTSWRSLRLRNITPSTCKRSHYHVD